MININFRQPKFLLPAVMFLPGVLVIYLVMDLFGAVGNNNEHLADNTDQINAELPKPHAEDVDDKFTEMTRRYGKRNLDSWSGITGLDTEIEEKERISPDVQEPPAQPDELILAEDAAGMNYSGEGWGDDADIRRLEEALARSRQALEETEQEEETPEEMETRLRRELGAEMDAKLAALQPIPASNKAPFPSTDVVEEQVEVVEKSSNAGTDLFNTVSANPTDAAEGLIKAMIDQTTKAEDGTRIRFKLLDDVTVKGHEIRKGSYLFGTVVGFGTQRVKVAVNSILANGEFIKVRLVAYDVDGMEGFYVPASAFREFMKDAASKTAQTNLQINNGYGSAISGEMLALQALQNIYNAASSAASGQFRKNKAKIKYNTIVYLINSESL